MSNKLRDQQIANLCEYIDEDMVADKFYRTMPPYSELHEFVKDFADNGISDVGDQDWQRRAEQILAKSRGEG